MYPWFALLWHEGGIDKWVEKQDKGTLSWKCVDGGTLASMGLTSGVRKVMMGKSPPISHDKNCL